MVLSICQGIFYYVFPHLSLIAAFQGTATIGKPRLQGINLFTQDHKHTKW